MPQRRYLTGRLSVLKVVLETAGQALSGVGLPGVEQITSVPLLIISYYETVKGTQAAMDDVAASLESLTNAILAPIKQARAQGLLQVPDDLRDRINELASNIATSAATNDLAHLTALRGCKRFGMRGAISSAIDNVTNDTSQLVRDFQLHGQITVELLLRNMPTKYDSLIEGLLHVDARFDASDKEPCLPDTRSVMRQKIHADIMDPTKVFVSLCGSPGTGKSAISKTVATELNDQERLAASYFFDKRAGEGGNTSLKGFVSSLVYQFAHFSPLFHTALGKQLDRDPSLSNATADVQLRKLLLDPMLSLPPPVVRWVVLIDALDECGDSNNLKKLMNLLAACTELRLHVTFFFTSRPESEILVALERKPFADVTVVESMDKVDPASTAHDILIFIQSKFKSIHTERQDGSSPPGKRETRRFAERCRGLFEIAAIRLRELESERAFHLAEAVRIMLKWLESTPASPSPLQDEYSRILRKAYPPPDPTTPQDRRMFSDIAMEKYRTLVGALIGVRRPLCIAPLAALVGMDVSGATAALSPLSSVIAVPKSSSDPVHFYHATFPEFILSKDEMDPTNPHFNYTIVSGHSQVALSLRCFEVMSKLLHQNICQLPDPFVFNADAFRLSYERLHNKIPDHLRYACLHWSDHLRRAQDPKDLDSLLKALRAWCTTKIMFYFELSSWLDQLERAEGPLSEASTWCKSRGIDDLTTLLDEARQFLKTFRTPLSRSAGAVYSSGIPFMPDCKLYECYKHLTPKGFSVVRGRLPDWRAPAVVEENYSHLCDVAFSPDGNRVVSGSRDGLVQIWSLATGEEERVLQGHALSVVSVAFSPDGRRIVSGSYDRTVRIWSVDAASQVILLRGHTKSVLSVAFSPDGQRVVSGSDDFSVRIWDAGSGKLERLLQGHTSLVQSVEFTPDGTHVISRSGNRETRKWDVKTGEWTTERPENRRKLTAIPDDGWLRIKKRPTWIPRQNRGRCWSDDHVGVIDSANAGVLTIYRM